MGNTQENTPAPHPNHRHLHIYSHNFKPQPESRCSVADHLHPQPKPDTHAKRNSSFCEGASNQQNQAGEGRTHKKFLSLSKQNYGERRELKKSSSFRDMKGIIMVAHEPASAQKPHHQSAQVIRSPLAPSRNTCKVPIRPKDLPRTFSSEKMLPQQASFFQPQQPLNRPIFVQHRSPPHPRIIVNSPIVFPPRKIQIAQTHVRSNSKTNLNNAASSLESSNVTQYNPQKEIRNKVGVARSRFDEPTQKKLKKVPLNRSFVFNQQQHTANLNNLEEESLNNKYSHPNREAARSNLPEFLPENKENQQQHIFTDPKLLEYLTAKPRFPNYKETESKYAIAFSQDYIDGCDSIQLEKPSSRIGYYPKYSVSTWGYGDQNSKLDLAVAKEVQSKMVIQDGGYRFPTLTDISQEDRTDNTSFIPNGSDKPLGANLNSEVLLKYCQPRIDSRVMADVLRLPLKQ